jgi:methyl-accepting chemotaxis protein
MNAGSQQVNMVVRQIAQAISVENENERAIESHVEQVRNLIEQNDQALNKVVDNAARLNTVSGALNAAISRFRL